jgi:hypothetical protein
MTENLLAVTGIRVREPFLVGDDLAFPYFSFAIFY